MWYDCNEKMRRTRKVGETAMEEVLVVERKALEALLPGEVFVREGIEAVRQFILREHTYLPREQAEHDARVKQIIPYVLIRRGEQYYLLRRLKKQTEQRLHDKLSLGVGGHINPSEEAGGDPLQAGLLRELAEEVDVEDVKSLRCVGLINENNGGVSDYHTALVYLLETEGEVHVRETEKMTGSWAAVQELQEKFSALETWSQIAVSALILQGRDSG